MPRSKDPVQKARRKAQAALQGFTQAQAELEDAAAAYHARVAEHSATIDALSIEAIALQSEADNALRVAAKLSDLTV